MEKNIWEAEVDGLRIRLLYLMKEYYPKLGDRGISLKLGINPCTLNHFLINRRKPHRSTIFMILRWVEKQEKEFGIPAPLDDAKK